MRIIFCIGRRVCCLIKAVALSIIVMLTGCAHHDGQNFHYDAPITFPKLQPENAGDLLYFEKVATLNPETIASQIPEMEDFTAPQQSELARWMQHDVVIYRVYYSSSLAGQATVLSGLVLVPAAEGALSHLQYFHGTIYPWNIGGGYGALEAPSLYTGGAPNAQQEQYETRILALSFASAGYLVSIPDYAGYSISKDLEHPYVVHKELVRAGKDLLIASASLTDRLSQKTNNQLFLSGWSEGGGAALAMHKFLTLSPLPGFQVAASAPFAGPYNGVRFLKEVIDGSASREEMEIYNWSVYALWRSLSEPPPADTIWKYPVANQFDAINVPSYVPNDIFTEAFVDAIARGEHPLYDAAVANSLHDSWRPQGKVFLHSGKADTIVPHYNSLDAYEGLKSRGGEVTLYEYEGDHYTPVIDVLITSLRDFDRLRSPALP